MTKLSIKPRVDFYQVSWRGPDLVPATYPSGRPNTTKYVGTPKHHRKQFSKSALTQAKAFARQMMLTEGVIEVELRSGEYFDMAGFGMNMMSDKLSF